MVAVPKFPEFTPGLFDSETLTLLILINGQEVPWHIHENEDELFYISGGQLLMEVENHLGFAMKKGDLFVVKKRTNHPVSSNWNA